MYQSKRTLGRDYYLEGPYQVQKEEFLLARGTCCDSNCRHCPYKKKSVESKKNKIISMVPSWTETLIAAGAHVVGRTRYCIHPEDRVMNLPIVGGTKNINAKLADEVGADFVLMDKEENTLEMSKKIKTQLITTHVRSVEDLRGELISLSQKLELPKLSEFADRYDQVLVNKPQQRDLSVFSEGLEWWRKPEMENQPFTYLIWKNPWMGISHSTFIFSVFKQLNLQNPFWTAESAENYPKFTSGDIPQSCILLFSSEPFDFASHKRQLLELFPKNPMASVDGEVFSWFGIRNLRFLEDTIGTSHSAGI